MKLTKNIVLIGMRGSGKSAIGRTLAAYLDWKLIDIDREIEASEGVEIPELVRRHDWEHFRDLETKHLTHAAAQKNVVISTGGGVILRAENVTALKKSGVVVLLHSPLAHLQKRVARSKRPSLTGGDPAAELAKVWAERRELYTAAADVTVNLDFETNNKRTDLARKSKLVLAAVRRFLGH